MAGKNTIREHDETTMTAASTASLAIRPRNAATANSKSKRKSTSLPPETVEYLKNWMMSPDHIAHPYPTEQEKAKIMQDTGIELKQLTNWFVNNRKRYWKPRVEARLQEQTKAKDIPTMPVRVSPEATVPAVAKAITKVISTSSMISLDTTPTSSICNNSHQQEATTSSFTTVTPHCSPGRALLEASNNVSDTSSVSSAEMEEDNVVEQEHTIRIDLHLLKPVSGGEPTEADMTTLSNIPNDQILRSFRDCYITYSIPHNATVKQEQARRDVELMQLKKQFLSTYFKEQHAAEQESKKRPTSCALFAVENLAPRPKYRRVSIDTWKDACKKAFHVYDEALPSLEEATQLFGYSTN